MQTTAVKLYSFEFKQLKTYLAAAAFVIGNLLLPQLCHLLHQGGVVLLPIYFFTLIGSYKYGWRVGLLTALVSPLLNYLIFAMPSSAMLLSIVLKSAALASVAGVVAHRFKKSTIGLFVAVVLVAQLLGVVIDLALGKDFSQIIAMVKVGTPGILLQIFGGYLFVKYLINK